MGAFRFKYATAFGPVNNFTVRTDNLFASTDATPDISGGSLFWTNNASATSITYFDGATNGLINPEEGQEIHVGVLDNNTTFVNSAQLRLDGGGNITATSGSMWQFVYHNSTWYETKRSLNAPVSLVITSSNIAASGLATITPATRTIVLLTAAASNMVLRGFAGGYDGQIIAVALAGSNATIGTNSASFTDSIVMRTATGTTSTLVGSGAIAFMRVPVGSVSAWHEIASIAVSTA